MEWGPLKLKPNQTLMMKALLASVIYITVRFGTF